MSSIKKIIALLLFLLILFCASWFAVGKFIENSQIKKRFEEINAKTGSQIYTYSSIKMGGFPFKYKYTISDFTIDDEDLKLASNVRIESSLLGKEIKFNVIDDIKVQDKDELLTVTSDKFQASLKSDELSTFNFIRGHKFNLFNADAETKITTNILALRLLNDKQNAYIKIDDLNSIITTNIQDKVGTTNFKLNRKNIVYTEHYYNLLSKLIEETLGSSDFLNMLITEKEKTNLNSNNLEIEIEYTGPFDKTLQPVDFSNKNVTLHIKKFTFSNATDSYDFTAKVNSKIGKVVENIELISTPNETNISFQLKNWKSESELGSFNLKTSFIAELENFQKIKKFKLRHKSKTNYSEELYNAIVEVWKSILNAPELQIVKALVSEKDIDIFVPKFHQDGEHVKDINLNYSDINGTKKLDIGNLRSTNKKYGYNVKGKTSLSGNMSATSDLSIDLYQYKRMFFHAFTYAKKLSYFASKFDQKGKDAYEAMTQENFEKITEFLEYIADEPVKINDKNIKISIKADSGKNQYVIGRRNIGEVMSYAMKLQKEFQESLSKQDDSSE